MHDLVLVYSIPIEVALDERFIVIRKTAKFLFCLWYILSEVQKIAFNT